MLLREGVLEELCGGFVGEHPRWSVTSIKLQDGFIGVALWRGCFPVGLLGIFWGAFYGSASGGLLLHTECSFYVYFCLSTFSTLYVRPQALAFYLFLYIFRA